MGQQADAGVTAYSAAGVRALEVVARDPEARRGHQHVVCAEPASCGVPLAGLFDTDANAGCALPVMASAAPVITARALAIKLGALFKPGLQRTITTQN